MSINNIVNEIIEIDNENKTLRRLLGKESYITPIVSTPFDEAKQEMLLQGLKSSISEYFNPFICPEIVFNEDTNEFITFEAWVQEITIDKHNRRYLPDIVQDTLTNKEIIKLYEPYLKFKYDLKLRDKQNELINESCES